MTQRSIVAGQAPDVTVHAGRDVVLKGWDGERVQVTTESLFGLNLDRHGDKTQVDFAASGEVRVPYGSSVKVFAGKNADVSDLRGSVKVVAGGSARVHQVHTLVRASAGGTLDIDCETLAGEQVKCEAGGDMRFCVRRLAGANYEISDVRGHWQSVAGDGQVRIILRAGGEVTLVTDPEGTPQPPHNG